MTPQGCSDNPVAKLTLCTQNCHLAVSILCTNLTLQDVSLHYLPNCRNSFIIPHQNTFVFIFCQNIKKYPINTKKHLSLKFAPISKVTSITLSLTRQPIAIIHQRQNLRSCHTLVQNNRNPTIFVHMIARINIRVAGYKIQCFALRKSHV